jgi:uncharacterized membrane protein
VESRFFLKKKKVNYILYINHTLTKLNLYIYIIFGNYIERKDRDNKDKEYFFYLKNIYK